MSSFHHIQHSHLHPDPETNHDDHQVSHLIPFFPLYDPSPSPSPSPFPYHSTLSLHSPQPSDAFYQQLHHHQDVEISQSRGSTDDPLLFVLHPPQTKEVDRDRDRDRDRDLDHDDRHTPRSKNNNGGSAKWMSSKMRLMRKMMNSDASSIQRKPQRRNVQPPLQEQEEHHPVGIVRVCSDCNTTKTPLWRSGPQGPKSLCNACGIRQRKAKKAMAAAAAAAVNSSSPSSSTGSAEQLVKHEETKNDGSNLNHEEKVDVDRVPQIVPLKKRCRYATTVGGNDANGVDQDSETGMGAQNNTQLRQVFPQDETKEAAILLMALSSDLACR